jgi:hypothetical protein
MASVAHCLRLEDLVLDYQHELLRPPRRLRLLSLPVSEVIPDIVEICA